MPWCWRHWGKCNVLFSNATSVPYISQSLFSLTLGNAFGARYKDAVSDTPLGTAESNETNILLHRLCWAPGMVPTPICRLVERDHAGFVIDLILHSSVKKNKNKTALWNASMNGKEIISVFILTGDLRRHGEGKAYGGHQKIQLS